ncbi:MAG: HD domain-containing protein [Planctomycetota bacterium]|nr:HD domain-containing protein [Planctomycetota bacterium]MDP6763144.1 HD domain-containing protein [Planctomycetota bacterium]MDP6989872.1 HD domain-containing protein [Planctomycetota bacterium]
MRDPVHGDVYLTHEELAVLDTPQMQRLRGIKQLGTAYLVYPGAVHTRFDHSIGSLHVAQQIINAVNLSFDLDPAGTIRISDEEARVVRLAALVHDITHIPFGHNLEDQDGIFWRHDSAYRFRHMLGPDTRVGAVLGELGVAEEVLAILAPADGGPSIPPYWSQIVSGTVASDILDYLARDAYFTGLRLEVDSRVTSYFKVHRGSGNLFIDLTKHDLLREDILSEIVRMLEARYYFSERVYYHHAKVASGAMVARAVELALSAGNLREEDFYDQTDASVLDLLSRADGAESGALQRLLDDFRSRRLFKRACVFPRYENTGVQASLVERYFARGGAKNRTEAEARIADLVRFASGREVRVIAYCPARRMQLKEARTHVRWPGVEGVEPLSRFAEHVPRLADLERSYQNLWKFYVFADTADPAVLGRVQEAAKQEFSEATNAYTPG